MTWASALAGIGVAAALLGPLAAKWQLPWRIALGWIVTAGAVLGLVSGVVSGSGTLGWMWLVADALLVLVVSALVAAAAFYRDPERTPPSAPKAILSPADGTVAYVRRFEGGQVPPIEKRGRALDVRELSQVAVGDGYLIGIGMNLLNVHVNRAPIAGHVSELRHTPGRFLSLRREDATTANERYTTVIDAEGLRVVVVQIASRLVRRIVSYLRLGQRISAGERIGMIKFGSQVDVVLPGPDQVEVVVQPGETVKAGVTVLAVNKTHSVKE